ncbi:MAG: VanZ family protein [Rhodovulum sp.]|nr:VanZ family protein [Rhodovulum sp.]
MTSTTPDRGSGRAVVASWPVTLGLHLARVATAIGAASILLLSVVPPGLRPVTGPHAAEHALAFLVLGVAAGLALPGRLPIHLLLAAGFTAAIELAQIPVPGRHARLADFAVDLTAAAIGLVLVAAARHRLARATRAAR